MFCLSRTRRWSPWGPHEVPMRSPGPDKPLTHQQLPHKPSQLNIKPQHKPNPNHHPSNNYHIYKSIHTHTLKMELNVWPLRAQTAHSSHLLQTLCAPPHHHRTNSKTVKIPLCVRLFQILRLDAAHLKCGEVLPRYDGMENKSKSPPPKTLGSCVSGRLQRRKTAFPHFYSDITRSNTYLKTPILIFIFKNQWHPLFASSKRRLRSVDMNTMNPPILAAYFYNSPLLVCRGNLNKDYCISVFGPLYDLFWNCFPQLHEI